MQLFASALRINSLQQGVVNKQRGMCCNMRATKGECVRAFMGVHKDFYCNEGGNTSASTHIHTCSAEGKGEGLTVFLPQEEGIISVWGMSKMASSKDNLKWFHKDCSSQHHLLETALPMLDVAVSNMQHIDIDRLDISFLSPIKWGLTFWGLFLHTPSQMALYWQHWTNLKSPYGYHWWCEFQYCEVYWDASFNHGNCISSITFGPYGEQRTPLTSNLSDRSKQDKNAPQQQNLLSPQTLKPESIQLAPIQEQSVQEGGGLEPIEQQVQEADVNVGACLSPEMSPVNLDQNFAATNVGGIDGNPSEESRHNSPSDDAYCVMFDKPVGYPTFNNQTFPQYSISDAWAMKSLAKSHSEFSGRSTSLHILLSPELHCPTCSFPESITTIFIGDKDYIHKCTNTNVWLDGDFLVGFTTVLYPYSHSSFCAPSASEKDLTHLVHVTHPKQK